MQVGEKFTRIQHFFLIIHSRGEKGEEQRLSSIWELGEDERWSSLCPSSATSKWIIYKFSSKEIDSSHSIFKT